MFFIPTRGCRDDVVFYFYSRTFAYNTMKGGDGVLAGKKKERVAPEFIAAADFHGLVDLLGAIARGIDAPAPGLRAFLEKLWAQHGSILSGKNETPS